MRFADGKQMRRFIPHQTSVDAFFRKLTKEEVNTIFGNVLSEMIRYVKKKIFHSSSVRFIADNSKYPYYGEDKTSYEIGADKLPGTKHCRMIQGHAIHSSGMTLYTDFFLLEKGKYRSASLLPSVKWLKWNGFDISYACLDREFYRAKAIYDLKKEGIPVIIPAKKFKKVEGAMRDYLYKKKPIVTPYVFSQKTGAKPIRTKVNVKLALIGHDDQSAQEVRDQMYSHQLKFDEAMGQMAGFLTTLDKWKNLVNFCRWLARTYKKRWNIETGFKMLNQIHDSLRAREAPVMLANKYLRGIIYNNWQYWRKLCLSNGIKTSRCSLNVYLLNLQQELEKVYIYEMKKKLFNQLKNKEKGGEKR